MAGTPRERQHVRDRLRVPESAGHLHRPDLYRLALPAHGHHNQHLACLRRGQPDVQLLPHHASHSHDQVRILSIEVKARCANRRFALRRTKNQDRPSVCVHLKAPGDRWCTSKNRLRGPAHAIIPWRRVRRHHQATRGWQDYARRARRGLTSSHPGASYCRDGPSSPCSQSASCNHLGHRSRGSVRRTPRV
jgi:hypothetical protein